MLRPCAIAAVFDALTSWRPYKEAYALDRAFDILCEGRGTHFDPYLLDLFLSERPAVTAIWRPRPASDTAAAATFPF